jgi:putative SOS response-associated peptidase YedK
MCGRFTNRYTWRELVELYRLTDQGDGADWSPSYNIAPTELAPVVRVNRQTGERRLSLLQWGLVPFWSKDPKIAYSTINARAETVAEKPAFREAYQRRRCLVPTSGFFEWREDGTKAQQPYHFTRADGRPLTLAGLWERWRKGDAPPLETFTIIVGRPTPQVEQYHDRAPIILEPEDFDVWLDHDVGSQALTPLLQPWRGEFAIAAVSKAVNSVKNDGPELLATSS